MDRLAIILGALSVGIGFGLQSLVNNLVSGLILAFEKPHQCGGCGRVRRRNRNDEVDRFRSSIITTWDGADVIIPNGKLLSEQLINWTMGNSNRRVEMAASVPYGTDLGKTKELLLALLGAEKGSSLIPAIDFDKGSQQRYDRDHHLILDWEFWYLDADKK